PEAHSAVGIEAGGPGSRRLRRSRALLVIVCALFVLAGGGVAVYFSWHSPEPPDFDREGLDPAIVAAVDKARAGVQHTARSALAWGKLGMVCITHDFRTQATFCLEHAELLDPNEVRWPYFQALGALVLGEGEKALPKLERAAALCSAEYDGPRLR